MTIGQVAAAAGVAIDTVRYYERRNLLPEPKRTASGYRIYGDEAPQLIRFIKQAQQLGFTLTEIDELVSLRDTRGASCDEVRSLAERKAADIDSKIVQLQSMRRALGGLIRACETAEEPECCPILESLDDKAHGDLETC
ncbi:MAG: MerR family DNA-binding protein [Myxococcales bacterium]|nr:MerR family DNA-binding protein [Myxococcales bacterium]